ncbi:hypothetical protein DFH06DRAFT_1427109 [Mycena polygramma]|nr:hypothetical protein DFH06DRAFT_1427109 [Mycena polygramma]
MAGILLVCLSGSLVRSASGNLLLADPLTFAPRLGNMTAPFTYLKSPLASGGECEIPSWVKPLVFDYDRLISKKKKYNTQQKNERREAIYQLFKNMCIGLVKRGKVQSETYTFVNDEKTKYENRKDAGCTGSPCAHLVGHSCDEFPFASTTAGGIGAHWDCIPEKSVNFIIVVPAVEVWYFRGQDIQGGVMGYWVSRSKVVAGSIFELQIVNFDCANPPPPPPPLAGSLLGSGGGTLKSSSRVDTSSNATILSMNQDVYPPFDESDSNNHTIISLGSLSAGSYNISANVSGVVSSAYIVDSEGAQFAQITAENGVAMTLSFNLPFDNIGIVLVMDTQADQINYNASLVVVDNTAPPSASPRPSAGGSTTPSSARSIRSGGAAAYMAGFFGFCIFF